MNKIKTFKSFVQKVLPTVYDDSLSYYELLNSVIIKLNEVITSQNETNDNFDTLNQNFIELKNFVDNYFNNLDVQDEINNKLDEMVENGTLNEIIFQSNLFTITINNTTDISDFSLNKDTIFKTNNYENLNDNGGGKFIVKDNISEGEFYVKTKNNLYACLICENSLNINQLGCVSNKYLNDYWNYIQYYCKNGLPCYIPKGTYFCRADENNECLKGWFINILGEDCIIKADKTFDKNTIMFDFNDNYINYNGFIKGVEFRSYYEDMTDCKHFINFTFNRTNQIFYLMKIEECLFGLNSDYSINTSGFTNGGFNNCYIIDNIIYGYGLNLTNYGDSNVISKNSFYGSEKYALTKNVNNISLTNGSSCLLIENNNITNGFGLINAINCKFINNQCENTTQKLEYILKVMGNSFEIDGCNFNSHNNCRCAVILYPYNCNISNCTFYHNEIDIESLNHISYSNNNFGIKKINGYVTNYEIPLLDVDGVVSAHINIDDGLNCSLIFDGESQKSVVLSPISPIIKDTTYLPGGFQENGTPILVRLTKTSAVYNSEQIVPILFKTKYF